MTSVQLFIKEMRDKGKQLKKSFHIYRGEEQDCCPICGVDLCRLADEIESRLKVIEEGREEYCTCDVISGTGFLCEKCKKKAYFGENPNEKVLHVHLPEDIYDKNGKLKVRKGFEISDKYYPKSEAEYGNEIYMKGLQELAREKSKELKNLITDTNFKGKVLTLKELTKNIKTVKSNKLKK